MGLNSRKSATGIVHGCNGLHIGAIADQMTQANETSLLTEPPSKQKNPLRALVLRGGTHWSGCGPATAEVAAYQRPVEMDFAILEQRPAGACDGTAMGLELVLVKDFAKFGF